MKSSTTFLISAIALQVISYFVWLYLITPIVTPEVKVGQVWVQIDSLDPFKPIQYDTIKVIEIKGDYAKIIWNGYLGSMETSLVSWRHTLVNSK